MARVPASALALTGGNALCLSALGCASGPQTTRVSADTVTDLTGYWNGNDVDIVCKDLIGKFIESPRVAQFAAQNKRLPVIRVGNFKNASSEPIDTSIVSKRMQVAILNSGKAEFAADSSVSAELRAEASEQQDWANEDTAAALADETGADFLLTGAATARVRYLINAALQNRDGEELAAFTENKRVTSNSQSQAAARALRDAEKSITETGFAKSFDEHLASLSG